MIGFIVGFFIGGFFGVALISVVVVGYYDKWDEKIRFTVKRIREE